MMKPEKMNLESMDIAGKKREQLKELFPEVFSENKVDFNQLKRALGEWIEPGRERFGLTWPGKAECMRIIQQPSVATLKPAREESVNFDDTGNLFIEGDNLEVLKLLQKSYFGKVKMIYIDPPYNTGNEFIYPDKYSETLETYLEYTGQKDSEGRRFSTNTEQAGRYHTNWLNMMYPRLYLARNLLREDGVIFISIDDNEAHNLRGLCDQIFGEENFVAQIAWQGMDTIKNDAKYFSGNHEHILCYSKNRDLLQIRGLRRTKEHNKVYKNPDNDPNGPYLLTPLHAKSGSMESIYMFTFKNGKSWSPPQGTYPRFSEETLRDLDRKGTIYFGSKDNSVPQRKTYLKDVSPFVVLTTFWTHNFAGSTRQSNAILADLMGKGMFENPKPTSLIKILLEATTEENDIILDFFAGSATTAHAVMQLNAEDGGNRKFVMVQLPEPTDSNSQARKSGYMNIADIGKERIRRAAKKIEEGGWPNGAAKPDLGFKVFKLDKSNFKMWEGDTSKIENLEQQLFNHIDHIDNASTPEDILYELLLKAGFPLTTRVEKIRKADKEVFSIEDGALLICLDKELNQAVIDALAEAKPLQVICLDEGFRGNDQLKVNSVQTFKTLARGEESEIVFKTV